MKRPMNGIGNVKNLIKKKIINDISTLVKNKAILPNFIINNSIFKIIILN